jgi:putative membrane protein
LIRKRIKEVDVMMRFSRGGFYGYDRGFHMLGMLIIMFIIVVFIGALIFVVIKHRNFKKLGLGYGYGKANIETPINNNKAMEILNEKFALGEITEEEYIKKKELINS